MRTVLVTGASSGIDRAIVEYVAARGDYVFAGARQDRDLSALGRLLNVVPVRLDVTEAASVDAAVAQVGALTDTLEVLVNNAGAVVAGPLMDLAPEALRDKMEVNLVGVHRVTRAFFPLLLGGQGPHREHLVDRRPGSDAVHGAVRGQQICARSVFRFAVPRAASRSGCR